MIIVFQRQDIDKLMVSSTVLFPTEEEVKRSIDVLEKVQQIKVKN